jgi:hypothetical protein
MKINALLPLCLLLGACADLSTSVVCPGEQGPSLLLEVVDASTGRSVADEASGSWATATVADSLRHVATVEGREFLAAFGPPGVYDVSIVRPGHPAWVRGGITVVEGSCGPMTRQLTAMMAASATQ